MIDSVGAVESAAARVMVICEVRALPAPSVATTVSTFAPFHSGTLLLQLAVLFPLAVPPVAAEPFTVTEAIPLPPAPLSLAVPANVMLDVDTVCPFEWLVIDSAGAVVSLAPPFCTVHVNAREVVARPSVTRTVTLNVPADVGMPVITPLAELSVNPNGRFVCVNCSVPPSGSVAVRLSGVI